jgi:hypothetical protein
MNGVSAKTKPIIRKRIPKIIFFSIMLVIATNVNINPIKILKPMATDLFIPNRIT